MGQNGRIILIGLDGAPYELIQDLTGKGIMPNLARILGEGRFFKICSSLPEISSVAWSTVITGKNPAEHGIYGFTDLAPESYTMIFPNLSNIKSAPFWLNADFSPRDDQRYAILNVPSTYPARPLNGCHVSGFVALDLAKAVYPESMMFELEESGYKIDVDAYRAHESMEFFLKDLDDTLGKRIASARTLWRKEHWDVYMLVFTGTDRLSHFLWNAYEDVDNVHHSDFLNHFRRIDEFIGELADDMRPEDTIAFVSDHGFELLEKEVFINRYLREWGFLKLRKHPAQSYNDIDLGTKAFCMDPGRIYINYEGEYPRGSVMQSEADSICNELRERFLVLEIEGKSVVGDVFMGVDIFEGQNIDRAPDMVLLGDKGFDLKGSIKAEEFYAKNIFNGKHTYNNAFFGLKKGSNESNTYPEVDNIQKVRQVLGL